MVTILSTSRVLFFDITFSLSMDLVFKFCFIIVFWFLV